MNHELSYLSNKNYRTYNVQVARIVGVNAAIIISDLQGCFEDNFENEELTSHQGE